MQYENNAISQSQSIRGLTIRRADRIRYALLRLLRHSRPTDGSSPLLDILGVRDSPDSDGHFLVLNSLSCSARAWQNTRMGQQNILASIV